MTRPTEALRARDIQTWDRQTDVLVIGLGGAGAAAALDAADCGADVVALERAGGAGGTTSMSGGVIYLGGGTPLQRDCGFEDSPDDMYRYLMASCGPNPDQAKIQVYCQDSVEHYHWFLRHNVPFKAVFYPHYSGEPPTDDGLVFSGSEEAHPYCDIARPAPRGHVPQNPHQAGPLLMRIFGEELESSPVDVLYDTRCSTLIVDDDRSVVGALVVRNGQPCYIRARGGVVVATGGFINNKDMLSTHAPLLQRCNFRVGAEGDDGSGIRMGMGVGGSTVNMNMGSVLLPITPPKNLLKGIMVNAQGQRFVNEDAYYGVLGEYALYRADGKAYWILDGENFEHPDVERPVAGVGEDIEELEEALALPAGSLKATVDLYNHHARQGRDPLFNKHEKWLQPLEPPYGAFDCTTENSLYAAFTLGGLRTTAEAEVLTADNAIIPGLYAAGRATACIAAPGYSSGLSIGDGTFFGRRAGRNAAQRRN